MRPRRSIACGLATLLWVSLSFVMPAAHAQGGFELSLPAVQFAEGTTNSVTVLLDNVAGGAINGFSLGVCTDSGIVTPLSVSVGDTAAVANGGNLPDFFQIELLTNGITVGCVVDLFGSEVIDLGPANSLVDIEYSVIGAVGQTTPLDFCETLGVPPVATVVVAQGVAATATQISGSIEIVTALGSTLSIEAQELGTPSTPNSAIVRLDTTSLIAGFSCGFSVIPSELTINGISFGADLAATHSGSGPDFFLVDLAPLGGIGATVVCTISSAAPFETLGPGTSIALLELDLVVGASPGSPCDLLPIAFSGTLGSPAIPIEVTTTTGAETPDIIDGAIALSSLNPAPPSGGITLRVEDRIVSPGSNVTVDVSLDSDVPISAVSFGIAYSNLDVGLNASTMGTALAAFRCGAGPEFFSTEIISSPQPGVTVASLFEIQPPFFERELPAGSDLTLLTLEFTTDPAPLNSSTELALTDLLGNPPVAIEVTVGTTAVIPAQIAGSIEFGVGFVRGNCNADPNLDLADAIFMLSFLFAPGSNNPLCDDACDANDDGLLNIADPIGILIALFGSSTVTLPAPTQCGSDPTPDTLECAATTSC